MKSFAFNVGDRVMIANGKENGEIIGRAEYARGENQYFVRYVAGDGRAVQQWWDESALSAAR